MPVIDLLRARAAVQPFDRAYTFLDNGEEEGATITWSDLERRSRALGALIARRAEPGSRVLILCPPSLDFVPAFFGVLFAGCVAVPAYPPSVSRADRAIARLRGMLADAGITIVVAPSALRLRAAKLEAMLPGLEALDWIDLDDLDDRAADAWRMPSCTPDTLALLQYTSGSTASPRGVMVTHGNLLDNLARSAAIAGHDADSLSVSWLPVNHDMGLIDGVLQPAFSGYPAYLMSPAAFLQRPARWLDAISRYRATHSGGPNFAYDLCARRVTADDRRRIDLSSWRIAFNGSEPVRRATLEQFQRAFGECGFRWDAFRPAYGLAESTLLVASTRTGELPAFLSVDADALARGEVRESATGDARDLVASGTTFHGARVVIVDPVTRATCGPDAVGEIWVAGASVAAGYWKRDEETAATFAAVTSDTGDGPFLRTGDLGFLRDGKLFVTGRIKDILIVRGLKHYPHDIESTAEQAHDAIRQGCCAAFAIESDGEERIALVAEVESRPNGSTRSDDLAPAIPAVRQAVAESHQIALSAVVLVNAGTLPKTTSGKLQRYLCRDLFHGGALQVLAAWAEHSVAAQGVAQ